MTRIYLAARYSRHPEMRQYRDALTGLGYTVTSRWIDMHGGTLEESCSFQGLNERPGDCYKYADADLSDLAQANVLIMFSSGDGSAGRGGRHIEFGYALGKGKAVNLVGPRENVFHTLPDVVHWPDWDALYAALLVDRSRRNLDEAPTSRLGWPALWGNEQ